MLTGNELSEYTMVQPVDYMEFDKSENPDRLYVAVSDGSGTTGSGSIYYLQIILKAEEHYFRSKVVNSKMCVVKW